jgi:hypothetical protein
MSVGTAIKICPRQKSEYFTKESITRETQYITTTTDTITATTKTTSVVTQTYNNYH